LVKGLEAPQLELFRTNFVEVNFLPKVNKAERIHWYILIYLLNVSFTKDAIIRNIVVDDVFRPTQTTFMQGINDLDVVVILYESIHELHQEKLNGVI
jgi:hypothetical protein